MAAPMTARTPSPTITERELTLTPATSRSLTDTDCKECLTSDGSIDERLGTRSREVSTQSTTRSSFRSSKSGTGGKLRDKGDARKKATQYKERYKADSLNLSSNPKFNSEEHLKKMEGRTHFEEVWFSNIVTKLNRKGKAQERILAITELAIYNLDKDSFKCKRRIPLTRLTAVVWSTNPETPELMGIQVLTEYDYIFQVRSQLQRKLIAEMARLAWLAVKMSWNGALFALGKPDVHAFLTNDKQLAEQNRQVRLDSIKVLDSSQNELVKGNVVFVTAAIPGEMLPDQKKELCGIEAGAQATISHFQYSPEGQPTVYALFKADNSIRAIDPMACELNTCVKICTPDVNGQVTVLNKDGTEDKCMTDLIGERIQIRGKPEYNKQFADVISLIGISEVNPRGSYLIRFDSGKEISIKREHLDVETRWHDMELNSITKTLIAAFLTPEIQQVTKVTPVDKYTIIVPTINIIIDMASSRLMPRIQGIHHRVPSVLSRSDALSRGHLRVPTDSQTISGMQLSATTTMGSALAGHRDTLSSCPGRGRGSTTTSMDTSMMTRTPRSSVSQMTITEEPSDVGMAGMLLHRSQTMVGRKVSAHDGRRATVVKETIGHGSMNICRLQLQNGDSFVMFGDELGDVPNPTMTEGEFRTDDLAYDEAFRDSKSASSSPKEEVAINNQ